MIMLKNIIIKSYIIFYTTKLLIRKIINGKNDEIIIHLYTLCWNEEKLLPFFIDHYYDFTQKITVYDNYSTDKSEQILDQYEKVDVVKYDSNGELNDILYLEIKNNAWKRSRGKADFVIVCDVDEFLYSNNLFETFRYLKKNNFTIIKPNGFQMVSDTFPEHKRGRKLTDIVKTGFSDNKWLSKSILFDPNRILEINYLPGAHECNPKGYVKMFISDDLKMLHYKDLSLEYLLNRKKEYAKRLSKINIEKGWATYYLDDEMKTIEIFKARIRQATQII